MGDALLDREGRPCATYDPSVHDGRPTAVRISVLPGVGTPTVVAALLHRFPGRPVTTGDEALATGLERVGAVRTRFAHLMTLDLRTAAEPQAPEPVTRLPVAAHIRPFARLTDELVAAGVAAYPPGHPDHVEHTPGVTRAILERIVAGKETGPLLECSRVAVSGSREVGAVLVTASPGAAPGGGPWLAEVFRVPDPKLGGVGTALLASAIAAARADGLPALGLAVSEGNPARAVYERLGFAWAGSAYTLELPSRAAVTALPPSAE